MLAAANAGSGGKPLTNQTVDEARFNLTMAWADVAMAGIEVGLETKALQRLASAGGRLAVGGLRLSRPQWTKLLQAARRSSAELDLYLATQRGLTPEAKALLRENVLPNGRTQTPPRAPEVPDFGVRPYHPDRRDDSELLKIPSPSRARAKLQNKCSGGPLVNPVLGQPAPALPPMNTPLTNVLRLVISKN
jgi:hypothetical protein